MIRLFLPFNESNLCNDYIHKYSEYNDRLCFLNQVDLNTNLLDNVILHQVVIQLTKKLRSLDPHKSRSKTTTYKKISYTKNKKFRSASTQLYRRSTEPNRNGTNLLQQYLFYTNKDLKNYTFIDVGTYISIVTWKLTKNCSHIISYRPLSSCLSYYESNKRSKRNDESSSIPTNDIKLFYCLIKRLLFTSTITRPSVRYCVTSLLTTMEIPMKHYKKGNSNTDILSMKKIQIFVLPSPEDRYTYFETLYYEHKNNILTILQQIIQSRKFMKESAILKGVLKNMIEWLDIRLPTDLTNYNTDHQEHTTNDTRRVNNKLINQGVKTTDIHYYNTDQESILSNIVIESDIYDNYSYNSCVNWDIEKTPETHLKKLEFYINKPETGLKKIDFNIIINNDEIVDMNNDKIVHSNDDQIDDMCSNINHHNVQQEQTNHI